ncbi:hypothetical protein PFICI_14309 [Pestalotiopsis fici W106-1]|uniref:Ran-specific GTPase-activating protein 30 n=1 Tax=Pestalotiopsis fici (strain W106-1 / CGMCC3.15140) TaxID=1229662 RepID=W3WKN4_PESFW|nr:uncharacterized protein PFICI_14309 [Pestalotiopsis fici W106-1]ETS74443.1 hypothetical protein PFICI_14309 [Pestalotiopsis fici W106-1]
MDAFLARVSYHATSYAIRSAVALTSSLVVQQGSRLLKTVDDQPLRAELAALQRRLARKIELISPILESIEFRYTRGNTALEAVVRVGRELREDIDLLAARYQDAAILEERTARGLKPPSARDGRAELLSILAETKQLMLSIDDLIPSINLWVSAIGGVQTEQSTFSPSRLLQASMLVNVSDSQFVLDPFRPMQIGPDFTLSLYMLFRGHASAENGEAYGIEEGQRKPMWQEVIHKARVRLYRIPTGFEDNEELETDQESRPAMGYAYQLQILEDLDDGRVHTFENGNLEPGSYDGLSLAGVRENIPIGQISKMFYADVGRILNINNEDGASSNPVLLLKRDTSSMTPNPTAANGNLQIQEKSTRLIPSIEAPDSVSDSTLSECSDQDDIDRQLREESQAAEQLTHEESDFPEGKAVDETFTTSPWTIPSHLDPEWLALEVFDFNDDDTASTSSLDDEDHEPVVRPRDGTSPIPKTTKPLALHRTSVDSNLVSQLQRMSIANGSGHSSSRSSSSYHRHSNGHEAIGSSVSADLVHGHHHDRLASLSPSTVERSPFGAIRTSLSLLEMLLRLASLQEFEQTTHLSIPDHVLKFYLDESASESGLHGKERWAARAETSRKMGFDPYVDPPGGNGGGTAGI